MTKTEQSTVRQYVADLYADRNARNVRILSSGAVHVTIDGDRRQMLAGRDQTGGVVFAGWDFNLLREATAAHTQ